MKLSSFTKYLHFRVINTGVSRAVAAAAALLLLSVFPVKAQDGAVRPSKEEAQAAWVQGDIDKAYMHYSGLLLRYSRDPLYQYYTGACLVRLDRDIQRAVTLLTSAINSSVNVKSVPEDVWFWYGRALLKNGSNTQAQAAFDRFSRLAGKKVAAEYEVQKYIDQCISGQQVQSAVSSQQSAGPVGDQQSAVSRPGQQSAVSSQQPAVSRPGQRSAVSSQQPADSRPGQRSAVSSQQPADSRPGQHSAVSSQHSAFSRSGQQPEAGSQQAKVSDTGRPSAIIKKSNDEAKVVTGKQVAPVPGKPAVRGDTSGIPAEYFRVLGEALERGEEGDSLLLALGKRNGKKQAEPAVQTGEAPGAGQLTRFRVLPGQTYSQNNPVPVEPALPAGLIYTIQVAAFRNVVSPALFRGLDPVFGRKKQGSDAVYFYAGLFRRIDDARKALPEARGAGFPDAFIIAIVDGVQVSAERASLLEKEWGSRPLDGYLKAAGDTLPGADDKTTAETSQPADKPQPGTVGTLSFRAEVMRINKPVKPDVIEKIEALAGTRGLDMIKNSSGETVFLIGKFITFESADEYVSLLVRNGYNSARVAAYVGTQEIPVDAARELLNKPPDD